MDDAQRPQSGPPPDARIAQLAAGQHGVAATAQLVRLGLGERAVHRRVASGRLHRIHRGVVAVGHPPLTVAGARMAAVLACGPGAVLSHRSAGALWRLLAWEGRIDVTTPRRGRTGPAAVAVHRTRSLDATDVAVIDAIPVTSLPRTLVDLAGLLDADRLERAVHEAQVLRLLDTRAVLEAIERLPGRRGTGRLRSLMAQPSPGPTRQELERRFLSLCRASALEVPRLNATIPIGDRLVEVDALWRRQRLVIELDGAAVHMTPRAFHLDRRRDAALAAAGYLVVRLTWQRVVRERAATADELQRILAVRGGPDQRR